MKDLRKLKTKAGLCRWDAGNGHVAEAYYCDWRKRVIHTTITPSGHRIV